MLFCGTSTNYNVHASALDGAGKSQTEYFDTNYKLILTRITNEHLPVCELKKENCNYSPFIAQKYLFFRFDPSKASH
jgi:hypothetical protein